MLDELGITPAQVVDARKNKISDEDAWELLSAAKELVVGKGKKYQVFNPETDSREDILKACLGRTGNLRAPTLRDNGLVIVGFNEKMYEEYLKN